MADQKNILVCNAPAADFVWRAGGAIALYASRGYRLRILCLSFGERGESHTAEFLGAEIRSFDSGDYPIVTNDETIQALGSPAKDQALNAPPVFQRVYPRVTSELS